ncbi:MAG: PE family protein [Mycobacteriaceae bacterium]|nr:PE family protein [Mycobacteriaceae bacterium]
MFVSAEPEALATAAGSLTALGATMAGSNAAAAPSTITVMPAASDEVSALTALQFSTHGGMYQAVGAVAQVVHEMFAATMATSGASYAATEAANVIANS